MTDYRDTILTLLDEWDGEDIEMRKKITGLIAAALYERVYLLTYTILRNREDGEEATQETFLNVFRKLHTFRGDTWAELEGWVFTIATREALAILRRRKREEENLPTGDETEDIPTKDGDFPGDMEVNEDFKVCFGKLSPREQEILKLTSLGLTSKEIGELLGLTEENVRVIRHRARKKLKRCLKRKGYSLP